jgi:hypothetical protein
MTSIAHTTTSATTTAPSTSRTHDTRGFWRALLAVVAPLPMLAKGISYLIIPVDGDASFGSTIDALSSRPGLANTLVWLDVVFCVLLVPALLAGCWLARRGAPRLATAAGLVAGGGALVGVALLGGPLPPYQSTLRDDLDPSAMSAYNDALEKDPVIGVGSAFFIIAIVIGISLIGAALWRSGQIPRVAAIAVILGGSTHPFLPGHVAQGIGLLVGAAGFACVSLALLRLPNDAFDLPPTGVDPGAA